MRAWIISAGLIIGYSINPTGLTSRQITGIVLLGLLGGLLDIIEFLRKEVK